MRRAEAAKAKANAAHRALAALEARLGDRFLLVTQNVDGLHRAAGSERLIEVHGSLWRTKCSRCMAPPFEDAAQHTDALPECRRCGALLRPDIVWFGEMLDRRDTLRVDRFIMEAGRAREPWHFIAVGTSGAVWPAAGYVERAAMRGAETWLINLDPAANARSFDRFMPGRAGDVLPALLGVEAGLGDDAGN